MKKGERISHILFMDGLKLFAKGFEQLDSKVNSVRIFFDYVKWNLDFQNVLG